MAPLTQPISILSGPSREELFDALRLRSENRHVTFKVSFQKEASNPIELMLQTTINGILAESGSGKSWLLRLCDLDRTFGRSELVAYFETTSHTGYIED